MENFDAMLLFVLAMALVFVIAVIYNVKTTEKIMEEVIRPHLEKKPLYMVRDLTCEPMAFEVTKQYYEDQVRFAIEMGMRFAVHRKNGNFIIDLLGE